MKRKAQPGAKLLICDPSRPILLWIYGPCILGCWTPYSRHAGCRAYIPVPVSRVVNSSTSMVPNRAGRQTSFSPRAFGASGPAQIKQVLILSNTREIESYLGAGLVDLEDGFIVTLVEQLLHSVTSQQI